MNYFVHAFLNAAFIGFCLGFLGFDPVMFF